MSTLSEIEKRYFEMLLGMQSGYVLDFSDATFAEFFASFKISIHGTRYQKYGTSKAKKLRAFWEIEPDTLVGSVLGELLDLYEAKCELSGEKLSEAPLKKAKAAVDRLKGRKAKNSQIQEEATENSPDDFLDREFSIPKLEKLPVEDQVRKIIDGRLDEARKALKAGAHLAVIFLCGSVLEAVLLGAAQQKPQLFNAAAGSPKRDGKVLGFHEWSLTNFIDVATGIGILKPDVQKFGHGLRDFRNYIHPYQQMASGFTPDEHTAKVSFQVLKAALASVAGER